MQETIAQIIILVILIFFSGFFSAAEIALFSLSHAKIRQLVEKDVPRAKLVERMRNHPQDLLITILIGNNMANIFAASFSTAIAIELFGSVGVGIATGAITLLILVFGEIFPKSFGTAHAERIALTVIRPIYFLRILLSPLVFVFASLSRLVTKRGSQKKVSEGEIKAATTLGFEAGVVEQDEKEMIERVFKLNDIPVSRVMTEWENVFVIRSHDTCREALGKFKNAGFSRAPVYEKHKKHIVGIANLKDVMEAAHAKEEIPVSRIMKQPLYCDKDLKIDKLLPRLQKRKLHLAVVRDNNLSIVGIVTLENILEELVGEIEDESD